MKIQDVMTKDARTCTANDTLARPAQLMWEGDCGWVPVVDGTSRVVGTVTDRDIAMGAFLQARPLGAIPVRSVMNSKVISCAPGEDLRAALQRMQEHQVRRLPVVDVAGRLAGVVALSDILRRTVAAHGRHGPGVEVRDVATAFARICEPREQAPKPGPTAAAPKSAMAGG